MISKRELKVNFGYAPNSGKSGVFFIYNPSTGLSSQNIFSCRETFEYFFKKSPRWIGFNGSSVDIKVVNKFFTDIEQKLNLEDKSIFYRTNDSRTIIVEVPAFWRKDNVRRGFFSLFLRCVGAYANGKSTKEAINSYPLARKIRVAIDWFLSGHTEVSHNNTSHGAVVETLHDMDVSSLSKFLIVKKDKTRKKGYQKFMGDIGILKLTKNEK